MAPAASGTSLTPSEQLQALIDTFVRQYNSDQTAGLGGAPPRGLRQADRNQPGGMANPGPDPPASATTTISEGKITLPPRQPALPSASDATNDSLKVTALVHGLDITIIDATTGEIAKLTLDPSRKYQPNEATTPGRWRGPGVPMSETSQSAQRDLNPHAHKDLPPETARHRSAACAWSLRDVTTESHQSRRIPRAGNHGYHQRSGLIGPAVCGSRALASPLAQASTGYATPPGPCHMRHHGACKCLPWRNCRRGDRGTWLGRKGE